MPDLLKEGWIHKEPEPFEAEELLDYLQYPADVEQLQANAPVIVKEVKDYEASLHM